MLRETLMRIKRDSRVMQFPRGEISSNIYRVKKIARDWVNEKKVWRFLCKWKSHQGTHMKVKFFSHPYTRSKQ